ncbi:MAG: glycosyltransferase family 4 protein [Sphingobacteriia bacterium]|nr:glycosyltransferase family 4 protein [Sphingobacteriia bacterium]
MRIVNCMFSKKLGGIEQVFLDYHYSLQKRGHEVLSICHTKSPLRKTNKDFLAINNFSKWDIFAKFKLLKIIRGFKPDLIITHGSRPTVLNKFVAKKLNIPLVAVAHNYWSKELISCNYLFTITHHLKDYYSNLGFQTNNIFVIHNMIEVLENLSIKKANSQFIVGAIGRFVPKKGFEVLIKAISLIKDKIPELKVVIGGEGELHANLIALAKNFKIEKIIEFPGWVKDKSEFYSNLDLFVLPSHHEPFGIVILEAMNYNIPVISTNDVGPIEIIKDKENGLLVPIEDEKSLAKAILDLYNNFELRQKLVNNAKINLKENFSYNIIAERIENSLKEILTRAKENDK